MTLCHHKIHLVMMILSLTMAVNRFPVAMMKKKKREVMMMRPSPMEMAMVTMMSSSLFGT